MNTDPIGQLAAPPRAYFHDAFAPAATVVTPSVFVAVRWLGGRLLLVRRGDRGTWELPGGRVEVGETAVEAAVRETAEKAAVQVLVTGLLGVFTDAGHVTRSATGEICQQFAVLLRARAVGRGAPHGNGYETNDAAWVPVADLPRLAMEGPTREWIAEALANETVPHVG